MPRIKIKKKYLFFPIVLIVTLLLTWVLARKADSEMRKALLIQTELGANSIDVDQLKQLTGTPEDIHSPAYKSIKKQLAKMLKVDKNLHFIYLMNINKKGKINFMVDDRPDGDPECSPPGSSYPDAPNEFYQVFETSKPTVEGPSEDSWGDYVSGCAVIIDPETGKPMALFAIDFNASSWYWEIASRVSLPIGLMLLLIAGLVLTIQSNQKSKLLRESEEKYHVMFDNSPDAYAILRNGKVLDCNNTALEILQANREHLINSSPLSFLPEKQPDGTLSADVTNKKRTDLTISGKEKFELVMKKNNGENFWADMSATRMKLYNEEVIFIAWSDISKRKTAQKELVKAIDEANKANKAKSEFLANMSHEIRTPLNAVIGFTDLLKNTNLTELQEQYAKNANSAGFTLLGIINDILDFSKIEAGMMDLEIHKADLIELVGQSVDLIKYPASKKNLEILLNIDTNVPRYAEIDPIRLKQILANLLGNAVKFTEKGQIELAVSYNSNSKNAGNITFVVRDTGIGIQPDQVEKLFKAFGQADSSTTRKFGGTGLGLIISEMIARKMGSTIQLKSTPGIGTTFSFTVSTKTEHGKKADISALKNIKRCLIIDDNNDNRLIMSQMLKNWKIDSVGCENNLEAIKVLESSDPFDIIICDYHMPDTDGIETIRQIRKKLKKSDKQPVILLHSSSDSPEMIKKSEEVNVRYRLTKPVKSDELLLFLCSISRAEEQHTGTKDEANELKDTVQKKTKKENSEISILVAEDNEFNLLLIKALLSQMFPGCNITTAVNGREAVMLWVIEQPDLILMDMQMPEMSGTEATQKIREQETEGHHTPVIALTAGALSEEKEKSIQAGMDEFLTKPINPAKLEETIRKHLQL